MRKAKSINAKRNGISPILAEVRYATRNNKFRSNKTERIKMQYKDRHQIRPKSLYPQQPSWYFVKSFGWCRCFKTNFLIINSKTFLLNYISYIGRPLIFSGRPNIEHRGFSEFSYKALKASPNLYNLNLEMTLLPLTCSNN